MRFEWDATKDTLNRRKHGISFASVIPVFMDPNVITVYDHSHSDSSEDRWISMGRTDRAYTFSYAAKNSSRLIWLWVRMARSVAPLIVGWLGIVSGVRVPSPLSRTIAMCSRSRTIVKPKASSAFTTLRLGASFGKTST